MVRLKLRKSSKDPELYYYLNAKGEKLWMYRHKYNDKSGKRREKKKSSFTNEKVALQALLEVKAATLRGETKQVEYDQITVGEWLDIWYDMNKKKWKESTCVQRELVLRLHLKPMLGKYKLQNLDRLTYEREFINKLEGQYKDSSIRQWHNVFKIAINAAVESEILIRNRFTKVAIVSDELEVMNNYLSPVELVTFLDDAKKQESITNYSFLLTIAYTGIRRGEAMGLQWKNIDFENNTIKIERTRDHLGVRSPKTKNSYRTISIDEMVLKQLESYKMWCKKTLFSYGEKITDETFVFITDHGASPISSIIRSLNRILDRTSLPKITIHGLRHTHCTILLNRGRNVKVIAERLGNTPAMVYNVYGHVLKESEQESVTLFSQSLEPSGANFGAN
ncbi:tyrosine-type recombinase/integrase [Sporosarcina limicola]|uniref:tyrosine-type recombinase/integrase n=1 Tax=Sporosarcina limicola TaxID=34101 RepID=UPI00178AA1A0|nr:tyrosine-type recombinase/integrase [Sporosarcina limicola]